MTTYAWKKNGIGDWVLAANDSTSPIATVTRPETKVRRMFKGEYTWSDPSLGNLRTRWVIRGSVPACKDWVERELGKFWQPPQLV